MAINDQILEHIKQKGQASPVELAKTLAVSASSITKTLASLVSSNQGGI